MGQKHPHQLIDTVFPVLLLTAGFLLFPLKGVVPSPDSAWYLKNAVRIYHDLSPETLMIRRPLFPFLISIGFHLFGNSIETAFSVVRVFFVLNLLLGYAAGCILFNRTAGIAMSLLLLTSFVINRWSSYLLLDAVIPFFIFFFVLLLYLSCEKKSGVLSALSGLLLGLTFLVKGVFAIFFMFLPLLLFGIGKYRTTGQAVRTGIVYITTLAVLFPWLWYCIQHNDFTILTGPMFDADMLKASGLLPLGGITAGSVFQFLSGQIKALIIFYQVYVHQIFVLSPVFLAALVYATIHLLFKENRIPLLILFFCLVLFSPIVYLGMKSQGVNFREGQFMTLYFLLYLFLVFAATDLSERVTGLFSGTTGTKKTGAVFSTSVIAVCLFFQMTVTPASGTSHSFLSLLKQDKIENIYGFALWRHEFNDRDGWAAEAPRETARWIQEHVPAGRTILCQWFYLNMLDYLTENRYIFEFIPYTFVHDQPGKRALFIWPRYSVRILEGNSLVALYEQDLLAHINAGQVKYVLATFRRNFLSLYLNAHPDFEMLTSITRGGQNIKVYETKSFPVEPIDTFKVKFHKDLYPFFVRAFSENRAVYRFLISQIQTILNWDDRQVDDFERLIQQSDEKAFWQIFEKVKPRTIY